MTEKGFGETPDSDVYSRTKEMPLLKLKHAKTKLKFLKETIAVIEREFKEFSPEILDAWSHAEQTTSGNSLINKTKNIGPRIDPRGTPEVISVKEDE